MVFLGKLGVDAKLLIAQIINFGLLLWLLKKFLYNSIIERIEKDEKELQQAKIQKEMLEKEKELFEKKKKQESVDSKNKAQEVIREAEKIAEEIKSGTQKEIEKEKQAIIKQIKSRLAEIQNEEKSQ